MAFPFAKVHPKASGTKQNRRRLLVPAAVLLKINSIAKQADRHKNNTKNKVCLLSKKSSVSPLKIQINHVF